MIFVVKFLKFSKIKLSNLKLKNLLRDLCELLPKKLRKTQDCIPGTRSNSFFSENKSHLIIDEFMDDLKQNDNFNRSFENLISKFKDDNIKTENWI